MITRQEAVKMWEQIADILLNKLTANFDCLDARNKFLSQFSDEPTPDQMMDEMRHWAISNRFMFRWYEHNHADRGFRSFEIMIQMPKNINWVEKNGMDREQTITEAYRRFKEAVK